MSGRAALHQCQADGGTGRGEIGYLEMDFAVMGLTVLRRQGIGFILILVNLDRGAARHIAETRMLEEMSAEGIAGVTGGLVARGNPGSAFDEVVAGIEGRGGEVVSYTHLRGHE